MTRSALSSELPEALPIAQRSESNERLGDYTITWQVLPISGLAIIIGLLGAAVAVALLKMIAFFTNLFFYQRLSLVSVSPAGNHMGVFEILAPVTGALIIGFMAKYGSEKIRGHGIPEAIESILMNGSRVAPKLTLLKPISSAISIGSGGPFGAEGPIIMTGGALGSLIAQFFHLTSHERKTLLVAGAAAGMSATFASPVAATLLGVELLLFEWKPRSFIPVALASATAAAARRYLLGFGPLFPTPEHHLAIGPVGLLGCVLAGILAGGLSALATQAIYFVEEIFEKLPINWMWWPAIGGVVVGIGGLIYPRALGVGYDVIADLLAGHGTTQLILGILFVKSIIWAISLGSGTSGGTLAPLLMMGGSLGGVLGMFLPDEGAGFWPLVTMAATLGGALRVPLTAVVFAVELTHDINVLLPLLITVVISYSFTVLLLKRSILTEKISRRGLHVSCEYAVDPLEILFVRDVMNNDTPEVGRVCTDPVVAFPDESLRVVVYRMAEMGRTNLAVVGLDATGGLDQRRGEHRIRGSISLEDMLQARVRHLEDEQRRDRSLRVWTPFG